MKTSPMKSAAFFRATSSSSFPANACRPFSLMEFVTETFLWGGLRSSAAPDGTPGEHLATSHTHWAGNTGACTVEDADTVRAGARWR